SQFRPGPAPAVTSERYTRDYNEVKEKGGTLSHPAAGGCPAPAGTDMARFWSGNFGLQWNQAARDMAVDRQLGLGDTARLLALANMAGGDAAIAVWDSKVHYYVWRPITAINLGKDNGNNKTEGDPAWVPFIGGAHFPAGSQTPPYPDYVSGANGLTGAFTAMLQLFFHTDNVPFEIYKAVPASVAICTNPRSFRRISDAAEEVVDARILLGIHFRFADTVARTLGSRVAWHVFANELRPLRRDWDNDDGHDHDD
ncbi:MAG TPA: vanadium-dependent haloperoxidase, partial [Gammaproteobacteria bacterium]|nr:vanadium-dependent haloperoxidase [Gammaproteobacteria bacterium]